MEHQTTDPFIANNGNNLGDKAILRFNPFKTERGGCGVGDKGPWKLTVGQQ